MRGGDERYCLLDGIPIVHCETVEYYESRLVMERSTSSILAHGL